MPGLPGQPGLDEKDLPGRSGSARRRHRDTPSALPPGAGVYIDDYSNPYGYVGLQIGLVHTSKQCTGS